MKVLKLNLYQSIHFLTPDEKPDFTIDFYSPEKTLKYLHTRICSFTGSSYICREAAIFGTFSSGTNPRFIENCSAGFSLLVDDHFIPPALFSEYIFKTGSYAFTQFKDHSPKGIKEAVDCVSNYIISHQLYPASNCIMLRMVHENGGLLTEDINNLAFQICLPLGK